MSIRIHKSDPQNKNPTLTRRENMISAYEALINLYYGNILAELTASGPAVDKPYVDLQWVEIKKLELLIARSSTADS